MGSLIRRKATTALIEDMHHVCSSTQLIEVRDAATRSQALEALAEMKRQLLAYEAASNVGISNQVDALAKSREDQEELLAPLQCWVGEQERLINDYDIPRVTEYLEEDKKARLFSFKVAADAEKETGIFVPPSMPKSPKTFEGSKVTWSYTVTDESLVPEDLKVSTVSKKHVTEVIETYGAATEIPGIKVSWTVKPQTRIKRKKKETAQT